MATTTIPPIVHTPVAYELVRRMPNNVNRIGTYWDGNNYREILWWTVFGSDEKHFMPLPQNQEEETALLVAMKLAC